MHLEQAITSLIDAIKEQTAHFKAFVEVHRSSNTTAAVVGQTAAETKTVVTPEASPPAKTTVASAPPSEAANASPAATPPTLQELIAAATTLAKTGGRDKLAKIVSDFKLTKVTDAKPEDYSKVFEAIKKAGGAQS